MCDELGIWNYEIVQLEVHLGYSNVVSCGRCYKIWIETAIETLNIKALGSREVRKASFPKFLKNCSGQNITPYWLRWWFGRQEFVDDGFEENAYRNCFGESVCHFICSWAYWEHKDTCSNPVDIILQLWYDVLQSSITAGWQNPSGLTTESLVALSWLG